MRMIKEVMHLGEILGYLFIVDNQTFFLDKETTEEITFIPFNAYEQVEVTWVKENYQLVEEADHEITDISGDYAQITSLFHKYTPVHILPKELATKVVLTGAVEKHGMLTYKVHITFRAITDFPAILNVLQLTNSVTEVGCKLNPETRYYEMTDAVEVTSGVLHQLQNEYPVFIDTAGYTYTTIVPHIDLEITKKLQPKLAVLNFHIKDLCTLHLTTNNLKENVC